MKGYFNVMKGARKKSSTKLYRIFGTLALGGIAVVLAFPLFKKEADVAVAVQRPATISAPPNPHVTALINEYESEMRKLMERSRTPGAAIAIVKDSSIVYLKAFGLKASNGTDSVDVNTAFRIASVSKCFASFLTGIMIEKGVLNWQDPIVKYMPEFQLKSPEQTSKLNVTHVLSHTTGLPYHTYTNMIEEGLELTTMLSMLKDVNLSNEVGKEYSYQNVAYSLIGEVIKNATHSSYEQTMREKVFIPLKMENASIDYPSLMSNENVARPHKMAKRSWVPTRINETYYNVAPAGGVNASIQDMAKWMVALLGHRPEVIGKSTLAHLYAPAVVARSKNRNFRKYQRPKQSYYGLGWRVIHYPQDTIVYHGGYVTGFRSEVGLNPTAQVAVCILANAPGELPDNGVPLFFSLFGKYRDKIKEWELMHGVSSPKTPL
jgi:beta-lactamase class C